MCTVLLTSCAAGLQERDRRKDIAAQKALEVEGVQKAKLLLRRQSMVTLCPYIRPSSLYIYICRLYYIYRYIYIYSITG